MDIKVGDLVKIKGRVKEYGDEVEDDDEYIVTFTDHEDFIALRNEYTSMFNVSKSEIIEVKRPCQYKTIYKRKEILLTKKEKEWLSVIVKPFKNNIRCISKESELGHKSEYIVIYIYSDNNIIFPSFKTGTRYRNMKTGREYSLPELGL